MSVVLGRLKGPERVNVRPSPSRMKLTYDDFLLFPDDGNRHELIDGEHYVTPSPNPRHQTSRPGCISSSARGSSPIRSVGCSTPRSTPSSAVSTSSSPISYTSRTSARPKSSASSSPAHRIWSSRLFLLAHGRGTKPSRGACTSEPGCANTGWSIPSSKRFRSIGARANASTDRCSCRRMPVMSCERTFCLASTSN
jgi:hypothetical protein